MQFTEEIRRSAERTGAAFDHTSHSASGKDWASLKAVGFGYESWKVYLIAEAFFVSVGLEVEARLF